MRESQIAAINAIIRPGVLAREVEQAHRDVFLRRAWRIMRSKGWDTVSDWRSMNVPGL